jgi:magnesium transporter
VTAIFIPLSFIAGVYGMNFDQMPELHRPWGYPMVLGLMAMLAAGLLWRFRRSGWI